MFKHTWLLSLVVFVALTACAAPTPEPTRASTAPPASSSKITGGASAASASLSESLEPSPTKVPTLSPIPVTPSPEPANTAPPPLPTFMLIARHNKGCLIGGGRIGLGGCNGSANQMWQIAMVDAQFAEIKQSGMCLTTKGGPNDDGVPLTQSSCARQDNQLWRLDKYGDWIQLVNKYSGKCVDAQQFGYDNIFQWSCKSGNPDNNVNDNDNQLWLRSTTSNAASSTVPPPGVYVTSIVEEYGQPTPAKREYAFKVTFANTVGAPQPYRWWVDVRRKDAGLGSGQTPKKNEALGSGVFKSDIWSIGRTCADYTAQVFWWRDYAEPHEVPFRDPLGQQPKITFNVCF